MRREMEKDKANMAEEIERLEQALEETARKAEGLEKALEAERRGRSAAEQQAMDLRIEHARLDERAKAAEGRAVEFKAQLESLQARVAAVAKQQERKGRRTEKAPKPQEP